MKFLKVGRVAIITRGRYAGKKVRFTSTMPSLCLDDSVPLDCPPRVSRLKDKILGGG